MIREILFSCVCYGSNGGHYLFQDKLKTKSYRQKIFLKVVFIKPLVQRFSHRSCGSDFAGSGNFAVGSVTVSLNFTPQGIKSILSSKYDKIIKREKINCSEPERLRMIFFMTFYI
jgi:hypothetical protein